MRKLYDDNRPILFRPERWSVTEDVFDEGTNRVRESVFAVANGYIGVRGFFEEGFDGAPEHTDPTVMLNGVYEYHDIVYNWRRPGFPGRTQVITRQANPLDVTVYLDGERAAMTRIFPQPEPQERRADAHLRLHDADGKESRSHL